MEKTRIAKYKKYRQKIKNMSGTTPNAPEVLLEPEVKSPPMEKKKKPIPTTTTSLSVDQIIEAHNQMVLPETEEERLRKKEAAILSARWRKVGIIALILLGICLLVALAAILAKLS
ncbi:MAG: hypothetical protein ACOX3K_03135 [Bacilli bacterium]|jgi:hypothetical protein